MPAATAHRASLFHPPVPSIPSAMTLLLLEALGALLLLVFIVWWTMFSGRRKGELPEEAERDKHKAPEQDPPAR
jgi:hypothetical protein